MAYADRYTGRDVVVEWTPSGGSLTTLHGDFTSFSLDRKADTVDVTAGNQRSREFLTTLDSLDWSLSIFAGTDAVLGTIIEGTSGLLTVYPKGKTTGMPIRSFNAIVTSVQETFPFDGAVEVEVSGVRTGDMIKDIGDTYTP